MLKVSKIVLSLFVMSGIAVANPTKDMNSLDKEFLFGKNDVNTLALNNSEMKDTNGKWFSVAARAIKHLSKGVVGVATHPSTANGKNNKKKK